MPDLKSIYVEAKLSSLIMHYARMRDEAEHLVATNNVASINSQRGNPSGVSHHTPFAVIDAVAAWKRAAICLAELVTKMAENGGFGEEEKIDPGKDP